MNLLQDFTNCVKLRLLAEKGLELPCAGQAPPPGLLEGKGTAIADCMCASCISSASTAMAVMMPWCMDAATSTRG